MIQGHSPPALPAPRHSPLALSSPTSFPGLAAAMRLPSALGWIRRPQRTILDYAPNLPCVLLELYPAPGKVHFDCPNHRLRSENSLVLQRLISVSLHSIRRHQPSWMTPVLQRMTMKTFPSTPSKSANQIFHPHHHEHLRLRNPGQPRSVPIYLIHPLQTPIKTIHIKKVPNFLSSSQCHLLLACPLTKQSLLRRQHLLQKAHLFPPLG